MWLRNNIARANLTCFWEELEHSPLGMIILRASTSVDGYPLRPLREDHMEMCKFSGMYDPGYRRVFGEIRLRLGQRYALLEKTARRHKMVAWLTPQHDTTGISHHSKAMFSCAACGFGTSLLARLPSTRPSRGLASGLPKIPRSRAGAHRERTSSGSWATLVPENPP